jgi:hypothetical protein
MSQAGTTYWFKGQPLPGVDQAGLGASAYWFNGQALPFVSDAGVSTVTAVGTAAGVGTATATGASTAASDGAATGVGSATAVSDAGSMVGTATGVGSASAVGVQCVTVYPISDVTDGTWTDQDNGTSLYAAIDETVASDTDYIKSAMLESGQSDVCEVKLGDIGEASDTNGHVIRYRFRAQGTATMNFTVALMDGASEITSWSHNGVSTSYVDAAQTLSTGQAGSITNYADLRLRFTAQAA